MFRQLGHSLILVIPSIPVLIKGVTFRLVFDNLWFCWCSFDFYAHLTPFDKVLQLPFVNLLSAMPTL